MLYILMTEALACVCVWREGMFHEATLSLYLFGDEEGEVEGEGEW